MYKTVFNTYASPEALEHGLHMALENGAVPEDLTLLTTEATLAAWNGEALFTPEPEEAPAPAEGEEAPAPVQPEPRPYFSDLELRRWQQQKSRYRLITVDASGKVNSTDVEEGFFAKSYRTSMDANRMVLIVQQHLRV